jgi:succinyl-diaminopimelate desuccinylase
MDPTKQLLLDLLCIDSTPGREGEIGRHLCQLLEPQGFVLTRQPVPSLQGAEQGDERFNLILIRGQPRLFLFGHLDTVPPAGGDGQQWTHPPLAATEQDGRIYGLGAVDMKGGIAAFVGAVLATDPQHLGICLTCDEEGKFSGISTFLAAGGFPVPPPELAVFAEPTDLRIINQHRACFEIALQARGRAAHAGAPELGCDASQLFECVRALKTELQADYPGTDLNIGYFQSGRLDAINVVPDQARAVIDVRPNQDLHRAGVGHLVRRATTLIDRRGLTVSHQVNIDMSPLDVEPEVLAPLCEAVRDAGLDVVFARLDGTSEAGELHHRLGVPCVHFGPGPQAMSHQVDEYIDLDMLLNSQRVFERLIAKFQR